MKGKVVRLVFASLLVLLLIPAMVFAGGSRNRQSEEKIIIETFSDLWPEQMAEALARKGLADKVEFRTVPQNQYENKIRMMIAGGEVGDIICVDAPNIGYYADMGALEPLDTYWDRADFGDLVGSAQTAMTWNGQIWASPLNESNCVLWYNKEMFQAAGVTAPTTVQNAWTMEQLLDAAVKLTKKDQNGNVSVYGIFPQMFSVDNRNEGMTYTQMLFTWWFGADIMSPDGKTVDGYFNSPASKAALQYYADLFNRYQVAPSVSMDNALATGKAAMHINGPWMVGVFRDNFPEFYNGKWGVMPLPRGAKTASNAGSWNLAMTKQSKNKALAWQVISAITDTEGSYIYCSNTGNLPARKSTLDMTDMTQPPYNIIKDQLVATAKSRPVSPVYPIISEAFMDAFNGVALGENVETAFNNAVKKMNDALK